MSQHIPAEAPHLIPRRVFFGNPDKASPQVSPDGTHISFLAPVEGVLNVWVAPADAPSAARPVTRDTGRGIRRHSWTYSANRIVYLQDSGGDENWHIYVVDLDTDETRDLTPYEGIHAQVQRDSHKRPGHIQVGLNDRDAQFHDLYLIDLDTGERQLVQQNDGFAFFVTDDDFTVRYAGRQTADGGIEFLSPGRGGEWEQAFSIGSEDSVTTGPLEFDKEGRALYFIDSRGRDTAALTSMDLDTGDLTTLASDDRADVADTLLHPTENTVQAVAFNYERKVWQVMDDAVASDLEFLATVSAGDVEIVSRTLDDSCWIVAYLLDDGPVRYYRYLRDSKDAQFLFTNRTALEDLPLVKVNPVTIPARDGLNLVCYYSVPLETDPQQVGSVSEPLPLALLVHGGPWARDSWGYNPVYQLLANRGYAVLSVNFRGSTGFGKNFVNSGNLEWGGRMHDDLVDAVQWAIAQGIADPERVAIMGGSYGGYATLVGMTFTPEVFACGVDIVGPSNLITLMETVPPYWQPMIQLFTTRVGDYRTEEGREFLLQRSPLSFVDNIRKPLLIGQGANDPRVKQTESDQIVTAMQEKGIPVTYVLYPDEGHGFARPENNLSFFALAETFLAQRLGGRCEPIGDALEGASITVPEGAGYVPGLAEALGRMAS